MYKAQLMHHLHSRCLDARKIF